MTDRSSDCLCRVLSEVQRLKQLVRFGVVESDFAQLVRHHYPVNTWNVQRALRVLKARNRVNPLQFEISSRLLFPNAETIKMSRLVSNP
jgi:hypothetical protein